MNDQIRSCCIRDERLSFKDTVLKWKPEKWQWELYTGSWKRLEVILSLSSLITLYFLKNPMLIRSVSRLWSPAREHDSWVSESVRVHEMVKISNESVMSLNSTELGNTASHVFYELCWFEKFGENLVKFKTEIALINHVGFEESAFFVYFETHLPWECSKSLLHGSIHHDSSFLMLRTYFASFGRVDMLLYIHEWSLDAW